SAQRAPSDKPTLNPVQSGAAGASIGGAFAGRSAAKAGADAKTIATPAIKALCISNPPQFRAHETRTHLITFSMKQVPSTGSADRSHCYFAARALAATEPDGHCFHAGD